MLLVGLSGYAQSGKDTLAGFWKEDHGFQTLAFADPLRELLYQLDPVVHTDNETFDFTRLSWVIDSLGWDKAKGTADKSPLGVRAHLQRLGLAARSVLGPSLWVDALVPRITASLLNGGDVVITDVRFPNEAQAIKDLGGLILRIERPGTGPVNQHPSETSLDSYRFDAYVQNDSTLGRFRHTADVSLEFLRALN